MIRLYKSLHPAALFLIPLLTLLLWLPAFFKQPFLVTEHTGVLDGGLLRFIGSIPKFFQIIIAVLLISVEAIYLNIVVNRHEVLYKNTYLPALVYVVLMSFHPEVIIFHQVLVVNLLIIFTFDMIFSMFKNEYPLSSIFNSGLLLSITSFVFFPAVVFLIYLLIVLTVIRSFNFREWIVAIVAFTLPYYFLFAYGFVTDTLDHFINEISGGLHPEGLKATNFATSLFHHSVLPFALFFIFMIVLALVRLRDNFYKNSIKTRSVQQAILILSFFILPEFLFIKKVQLFYFTQLAIPLSIILGYYYVTAKKRLWLYEASFWILVILIIQSHLN